jgi:hypothetical protein
LKPIRTIALLAAAAAPLAAAASGPVAQPRPADGRETRGPQPARDAPELICRSVEIAATGDTPMVCMTAAEWRRAEQ